MPAKSQVAMVLLREPQFEGVEKLKAALEAEGGEFPPVDVQRKDNTISFQLGDDKIVISSIKAPIPWSDLKGPCSAAWYWPEAAGQLRPTKAHFLVVVAPGTPDLKAAAVKLTKVTAALVESSSAAGVLWGGSGTAHAPQPFRQTADEISADRLPVEIWVGFGLIPESNQTHSVFTSGLEDFGMQEIEIHSSQRDPQFLYERLFDIVHYVLRKDVVLHDGETIGISDTERITIQETQSLCDGETSVLQLDM
jgi:uncharacterized protein DUF4261